MSKGTTRAVTYFGAAILVTVAVIMAAGGARAQGGHACVYANDEVGYDGDNNPNTVDGYLVTGTSQTYLSPVGTGGTASGSSEARDIVVNPPSTVLYVADAHSGDIAAMKIKKADCELKNLGNYTVGPSPKGIGLAISPDGKWMYASRVSHEKIDFLAVRNDGSLSGVRQEITLPDRPLSMAVTPDGATLIVMAIPIRGGMDEAFSYAIDPTTGMLTQVSIVPTKGIPGGFSIDSEGKFVYVSDLGSSGMRVSVLEIGEGSILTFVRPYTFSEASYSDQTDTLLSADGRYLYVTDDYNATVVTLGVNDVTGALRYVSTASDGIMTEDHPKGLAKTKSGAFIFTGNIGSSIGILASAEDGSLTSLGRFTVMGTPIWLAATTF